MPTTALASWKRLLWAWPHLTPRANYCTKVFERRSWNSCTVHYYATCFHESSFFLSTFGLQIFQEAYFEGDRTDPSSHPGSGCLPTLSSARAPNEEFEAVNKDIAYCTELVVECRKRLLSAVLDDTLLDDSECI
eukprot:m.320299 g.320299  ORF g.320299 m.320299 type:complete len:134 (+) comp55509_c0_seq9:1767-2168(+)